MFKLAILREIRGFDCLKLSVESTKTTLNNPPLPPFLCVSEGVRSLPASRLQHVGIGHRGDSQALHSSNQVLAYFK